MSRTPIDPLGNDDAAGDVAVLTEGDYTLVLMYGEIDVRVSDDLEHAGRYSIDARRPTLMDVRRVTMMDSVGVSFVVRLAAGLRAAGTWLVLRGPCPRVAELITLVGADELVRWTTPDRTGEIGVITPAGLDLPTAPGGSEASG